MSVSGKKPSTPFPQYAFAYILGFGIMLVGGYFIFRALSGYQVPARNMLVPIFGGIALMDTVLAFYSSGFKSKIKDPILKPLFDMFGTVGLQVALVLEATIFFTLAVLAYFLMA